MKILELFAGTKSFSNVCTDDQVFTSDIDPSFDTDYCVNIMNFDISQVPFKPDIIWASPPCEGFSVASIGKHWNKDNTPKSDKARQSLKLVEKTLEIIDQLKPKYFVIENPRGKLRKLPIMDGLKRYTVTYCQYGDTRMKPTDLWTNADLNLKPICKNGMPCHISAPRGSRTGTQGIGSYKDKSRIPNDLCKEVRRQLV